MCQVIILYPIMHKLQEKTPCVGHGGTSILKLQGLLNQYNWVGV